MKLTPLSNDDLTVIQTQLIDKQELLLKRKHELVIEDPFSNPDRLNDNAAIDTEAAEQFGHDTISAIGSEVDVMLAEIKKALDSITRGDYGVCLRCMKAIEPKRLLINPTAELCSTCQHTQQLSDAT
jgi:RNA polymerase-binding transcription factor DksA